MNELSISAAKRITVVKIDVIVATLRDAQPLWDEFEYNLLFDRKKIVVDLSYCDYVDSTFIGMLIKIYKKVTGNGGNIKLVFPQMASETQFWALKITNVIECFNTVQEAIDNYQAELPLRDINYNEDMRTDNFYYGS